MTEEKAYVYILKCSDCTLYTGWTNNLDRRLAAHNAGTASKYTRSKRPVEMVWHEQYADKSAALKREAEIKKLPREKKMELIKLST